MKKYRAFDINWETDGEEVELPTTAEFELEDDQDPSLEGADALSEKYGWLINDFDFEEISIFDHFTKTEQSEILEIARMGLAMVFTEIAEELDISDEYLNKLQEKIIKVTDEG